MKRRKGTAPPSEASHCRKVGPESEAMSRLDWLLFVLRGQDLGFDVDDLIVYGGPPSLKRGQISFFLTDFPASGTDIARLVAALGKVEGYFGFQLAGDLQAKKECSQGKRREEKPTDQEKPRRRHLGSEQTEGCGPEQSALRPVEETQLEPGLQEIRQVLGVAHEGTGKAGQGKGREMKMA